MKKKEHMVRYTSEELKAMPSGTDWERVNALTDEDIEQAISSDPNAAPLLSEEFFRTAELVRSSGKKQRITIMVDSEILAFFKQGNERGYQSRMNEVLRAFVRHENTPHHFH
jgi:uncharacterized protein (DUF4415 family)